MEEELGLEQLKSVYKAQTEAYLEFNMALINILSNQKELLNKVESLKVLSEDEFRDLSEDYHALEALFVNFQNTQTSRDGTLNDTTEEFTATLSSFGADIDSIKEDINTLKKSQYEIKNNWQKIGWTLGGIVFFLSMMQVITGKTFIDWFK
jgi:seryl-tRNA synthetase